MRVLLINGSPAPEGCTYTALRHIATALEQEGVGARIFHIGTRPLSGCLDCGLCAESGRCVIEDSVNDFLDIADEYDGYVFGSPVHYAAASGAITSFMDRVFFLKSDRFAFKPAAAVVSCRRGGATTAFDQLNKYFTISNMPVVSSQYWNMVHGMDPEEVEQDIEGLQIMRTLGRNMAWLLRSIEAGRQAGIKPPKPEKWTPTNFIR